MQRNCVFFRGAVKWPQSASPSHEIPSCCWPEVYQRGDRQTNCWPKGVILVNPRAMEIFLKIKPNLKPKLLQFTDLLTSMDIVWKKLRRGYDPWEWARLESIISQAKCAGPASLQESRTRTGIAQHPKAPLQGRDTELHSAVTAQGKSLLCSTGISLLTPENGSWFCFKVRLLFLYKNCIAAYCLLTAHLCPFLPLRQVLPRSSVYISWWCCTC